MLRTSSLKLRTWLAIPNQSRFPAIPKKPPGYQSNAVLQSRSVTVSITESRKLLAIQAFFKDGSF